MGCPIFRPIRDGQLAHKAKKHTRRTQRVQACPGQSLYLSSPDLERGRKRTATKQTSRREEQAEGMKEAKGTPPPLILRLYSTAVVRRNRSATYFGKVKIYFYFADEQNLENYRKKKEKKA